MRTFFLLLFVLFSTNSFSQEKSKFIEISPFIRFDKYPTFGYAVSAVYSNKVDIKGESWGVNGNYKSTLAKNWFYKIGLGYYKYSFDQIRNENNFTGESNFRIVEYYGQTLQTYLTDKYYYNCISFNLGIEHQINIGKNTKILPGINLNNYYTVSQYYRINANKVTLSDGRCFGLSANFSIALIKCFDRMQIGPNLIVPVFDLWKQDEIFPNEKNSDYRNKSLGGFGCGFLCSYSLRRAPSHHRSHLNTQPLRE